MAAESSGSAGRIETSGGAGNQSPVADLFTLGVTDAPRFPLVVSFIRSLNSRTRLTTPSPSSVGPASAPTLVDNALGFPFASRQHHLFQQLDLDADAQRFAKLCLKLALDALCPR